MRARGVQFQGLGGMSQPGLDQCQCNDSRYLTLRGGAQKTVESLSRARSASAKDERYCAGDSSQCAPFVQREQEKRRARKRAMRRSRRRTRHSQRGQARFPSIRPSLGCLFKPCYTGEGWRCPKGMVLAAVRGFAVSLRRPVASSSSSPLPPAWTSPVPRGAAPTRSRSRPSSSKYTLDEWSSHADALAASLGRL